jgi:hypothetical protein
MRAHYRAPGDDLPKAFQPPMSVSVYRPVKGRLTVKLPFRSGGGNFDLLKEICGERTRPVYDRATSSFQVAANHLGVLIDGLLDRFRQVTLTTQHYRQQTCVESCWNASPDSIEECVCGCAGLNHGSRRALGTLILDGSVSVSGEYLERTRVLRR